MPRSYQRTPKVFNASFQPPKQKNSINWAQYKPMWPLLLLVAVVAGILLIGRLPVFAIKTVEVTGTNHQEIIVPLEELKGQSIFSRKISQVRGDLINRYLIIEKLDCRRGLPDYLKCDVALRSPSLIWRTQGRDYLVDKDSYIYDEQKTLATGGLIIEDKQNIAVSKGQKVLNTQLVEIYNDVYNRFQSAGYVISQVYIKDTVYQIGVVLTGTTSAEIPYPTGKTVTILMAINNSIPAQVTSAQELFRNKSAQINSSVDLRVPGYAYIK